MTETHIGVEDRTRHAAGTAAVVAVFATAMVIEAELQSRGYGEIALAIYGLAVPVLVWSVADDIRRLQN